MSLLENLFNCATSTWMDETTWVASQILKIGDTSLVRPLEILF